MYECIVYVVDPCVICTELYLQVIFIQLNENIG